ncbi:hypothetical protein VKT23_011990 [Stygiomarasmius scandens]|uniref:3'-5' exonuclease n=1 Tax=Marasmiellus scandens TaxID=2682957 RepID=A0ABR1J7I6_9AGAR
MNMTCFSGIQCHLLGLMEYLVQTVKQNFGVMNQYADNMADKDFLERCFPSLKEGVDPVEKYSHLEPLAIPSDVSIETLDSELGINEAMRSILQLLPENDEEGYTVIGFDMEWNVEMSGLGYVTGRGQTALIQICCGKKVYLLQVGKMLAGGSMPLIFRQVLENPRILKVGRNVAVDFKYLQQTCGVHMQFSGAIDLSKLAKERLVTKTAKSGLGDLCATVLQKRLNKNVSERISSAWENDTLTDEQKMYAALDAFASLAIYNALIKIPVPAPLALDAPPNTLVLLYGEDKTRLIARGILLPVPSVQNFDGINITPTRALIQVDEVYVIGSLITTHHRKALSEFGQPPFQLVCLRSRLRQAEPGHDTSIFKNSFTTTMHQTHVGSEQTESSTSTESTNDVVNNEGHGIGEVLLDMVDYSNDISGNGTSVIDTYLKDPKSQEEGTTILNSIHGSDWLSNLRSRILNDPYHIFNRFYIPVNHGLRLDFALALRDAIFIPDSQDKARITAWASSQKLPKTWEQLV